MPFDNGAPCTVCKGKGVIVVDDLTDRLCQCAHFRMMRAHLGPEFASARKINSSPLYERGAKKGDPPTIDRTRENLFIRGHWVDLLPHFRFTLILKGLMFRTQVITDERIKTVYVGADATEKRTREEREHLKKSFNSLQDIVCEHDLTIIRLGFLGHPNRAMPGALKEALMLREVHRKPTWIVENPSRPFDSDHRAYSEEVSEYILANFTVLDLTDTDRVETPEERQQLWRGEVVHAEDLDEAARPAIYEELNLSDDTTETTSYTRTTIVDSVMEGNGKKRGGSWGKKPPRGGGGGPVGV